MLDFDSLIENKLLIQINNKINIYSQYRIQNALLKVN